MLAMGKNEAPQFWHEGVDPKTPGECLPTDNGPSGLVSLRSLSNMDEKLCLGRRFSKKTWPQLSFRVTLMLATAFEEEEEEAVLIVVCFCVVDQPPWHMPPMVWWFAINDEGSVSYLNVVFASWTMSTGWIHLVETWQQNEVEILCRLHSISNAVAFPFLDIYTCNSSCRRLEPETMVVVTGSFQAYKWDISDCILNFM